MTNRSLISSSLGGALTAILYLLGLVLFLSFAGCKTRHLDKSSVKLQDQTKIQESETRKDSAQTVKKDSTVATIVVHEEGTETITEKWIFEGPDTSKITGKQTPFDKPNLRGYERTTNKSGNKSTQEEKTSLGQENTTQGSQSSKQRDRQNDLTLDAEEKHLDAQADHGWVVWGVVLLVLVAVALGIGRIILKK